MANPDDAQLEAWRGSVAVLGGLLVDLEANPIVALARGGQLTGESAAAWAEAEVGVATAWTTYQEVGTLLDQASTRPSALPARLAATTIAGTDPTSAMRAAKAAVEAAIGLAQRLAVVWEDLARRVDAARASAAASGDLATARGADALRDLISHDPLAVSERDLVGIEASADESARRRSATTTATARLDLDLVDAGRALEQLDADLQHAAATIDHAMSRIAGLSCPAPVPDLDALADWLARIQHMAADDPAHAAAALDDWMTAAGARRAELDAALAPLTAGLRRRDQGRGLWGALRAKAAGRRLDEHEQVAAALAAAKHLLWQAPCDLDAAEASLTRLSALLDGAARPEAPR